VNTCNSYLCAQLRLVVSNIRFQSTSISQSLQAAPQCRLQRRSGLPAHDTARKQCNAPATLQLEAEHLFAVDVKDDMVAMANQVLVLSGLRACCLGLLST